MGFLKAGQLEGIKPQDSPTKAWDGDGLYLHVMPATKRKPKGSKLWRFRYYFRGSEKLLALGVYPHVSLGDARERRDNARKLLAKEPPQDPAAVRKEAKHASANTFQSIAEAYLTKRVSLAPRTLQKMRSQLRMYVFPWIGGQPIRDITVEELKATLRRIEARGKIETVYKTKELCGRVFRYAISEGLASRDIAADLSESFKDRPTGTDTELAAITTAPEVGKLLRALDGYDGQPATRAALLLLPHVFLRQGELRRGRWAEVDLDAATWLIPSERMKGKAGKRVEHLVPLSRQAVGILRGLHEITGDGEYMFPAIGPKRRPISENTLGAALRTLGYTSDVMVPHGFRSMASTLLHEWGFEHRDIEQQLAHLDADAVARKYNRSKRIEARTKMMQAYSDGLDALRAGKPIPKRRTAA
jgi:integrase